MVRRCPKHQKDLAWDEVEKAYEVAKDEYAAVTHEELSEAEGDTGKGTIEIVEFVDPSEVDLAYIEQSYWVGPGGTKNAHSFELLRAVLARSGRVAIAKVAIRSRMRLALLRPRDKFFSLDMMRFADELVPPTELVSLPAKAPSEKELKLAQGLVDQLTNTFDPERHPDEYRARIEALVEEKVENHQTQTGEPGARARGASKGADVIDLSELLARSLKTTKGPGTAKVRKAQPQPLAEEGKHAPRRRRAS
jgi:DNA end-binding protein Ku